MFDNIPNSNKLISQKIKRVQFDQFNLNNLQSFQISKNRISKSNAKDGKNTVSLYIRNIFTMQDMTFYGMEINHHNHRKDVNKTYIHKWLPFGRCVLFD